MEKDEQNFPEKWAAGYLNKAISVSFYGNFEIKSLSNQKIWAP